MVQDNSADSHLIRGAIAIDPEAQTEREIEVWVEDGRIRAMGDRLEDVPETVTVVDAAGCILAPGLVDLYGRSSEPGFETRETLDELQRAALAGGYTRLAILPQTQPPLDSPAGLAQVRDRARQTPEPRPHLYLWGALTQGAAGSHMAELADLQRAGAVGFADGRPIEDRQLLRRLLDYARLFDLPVALYACDRPLAQDGCAREGLDAYRLGLPGISPMAETAALSVVLECVAEFGTSVHIMRVSTARGVALVEAAKARGLPVTASTPWTHLVWDTADLVRYDTNLHLDPPLGTPRDRQCLVEAVRRGTIDAIATDHSPYTYEEKTVAFAEAPPGTIGLEFVLATLWQRWVASGVWTASELWQALSCRPAFCLQQPPPRLEVGEPAELVLFDPHAAWTVNGRSLVSSAANTPLWGDRLSGRVRQTWCASTLRARTRPSEVRSPTP